QLRSISNYKCSMAIPRLPHSPRKRSITLKPRRHILRPCGPRYRCWHTLRRAKKGNRPKQTNSPLRWRSPRKNSKRLLTKEHRRCSPDSRTILVLRKLGQHSSVRRKPSKIFIRTTMRSDSVIGRLKSRLRKRHLFSPDPEIRE